ncbi:MAG: ATP-binding protein, partial [Candidatus Thalassarchaeaceae archaeon]|nr:ATP-binding protein [Candidatus Thalassarchaeaceae archaeon]
QNFPFLEDSKLLIAISGGIDSVVLAHLCSQLDLNFSLCHCNFNLRGQESDDDEAFVTSMIPWMMLACCAGQMAESKFNI